MCHRENKPLCAHKSVAHWGKEEDESKGSVRHPNTYWICGTLCGQYDCGTIKDMRMRKEEGGMRT